MSSTGLLTINLRAIASNWQYLKDKICLRNPNAVCAAVVKANAYGLGVRRVSSVLIDAGCKHFFVATIDEAVELRLHLGSSPTISVLGGIIHGLSEEWLRYKLTPVLIDCSHLEVWAKYCKNVGMQLPCAIKVDTGMHRLGVSPDELSDFFASSDIVHNLNINFVMSHLACADNYLHPQNTKQLESFNSLAKIVKRFNSLIGLSLCNSSGIFLGDDFHFDLCRPGSSLYGVNPTPHLKNPMQTVVNLTLPVMQLRTINAGESVGYGASYTVTEEVKLAVVFGGYADGLIRQLSNNGYGFCNGVKVPLLGKVSMDSIVFDVTKLDFDPQKIEVLNDIQGVDELASQGGTIGYEVLTSLGNRYHREYL